MTLRSTIQETINSEVGDIKELKELEQIITSLESQIRQANNDGDEDREENKKKKQEEWDEAEAAIAFDLQAWILQAILPSTIIRRVEEDRAKSPSLKGDLDIETWHRIVKSGFQLLEHLQQERIVRDSQCGGDIFTPLPRLIMGLAAYTDIGDYWTNPELKESAEGLIARWLEHSGTRMEEIVKRVLQEEVRPVFARSRNPALTQQGRKAIAPLSQPAEYDRFDHEAQRRKRNEQYVNTVLKWAVEQSDDSAIEENWPLIIAPVLTLVDEAETSFKVKGCEILTLVLEITSSALLQRTGLGDVIRNALMSGYLSLPTLTPEDDSIRILKATFPPLMALVRVQWPSGSESFSKKHRCFDHILTTGILKAYTYAGEYVRIAEVLLTQTARLVTELGIACVRHLNKLVPLVSTILSAPFSTSYPPLLQVSLELLQAMILNGWPRMAYWRGDVLKGLLVSWIRIQAEQSAKADLQAVSRNIEATIKLFTEAIKDEVNVGDEYRSLATHDPRIEVLISGILNSLDEDF